MMGQYSLQGFSPAPSLLFLKLWYSSQCCMPTNLYWYADLRKKSRNIWTRKHLKNNKNTSHTYLVGRNSSVGMATRYGLDGPGIESWWGEVFRTRPDRPWSPPSLLYNGFWVFPGGKAAGARRWPSTPSSAEVKERAQPYIYSNSGPSWPVIEWPLPLTLPHTFANAQHCWQQYISLPECKPVCPIWASYFGDTLTIYRNM